MKGSKFVSSLLYFEFAIFSHTKQVIYTSATILGFFFWLVGFLFFTKFIHLLPNLEHIYKSGPPADPIFSFDAGSAGHFCVHSCLRHLIFTNISMPCLFKKQFVFRFEMHLQSLQRALMFQMCSQLNFAR